MDQEDINVSGKPCLEAEDLNASMIKACSYRLDHRRDEEEGKHLSRGCNKNGYVDDVGIVLSSPGIISGGVKSNLPPQKKKMGPVLFFFSSRWFHENRGGL